MAKKLDDTVAIVTGAGRGIGRAIALRFAHDGSRVVLAEKDHLSGKDAARHITEAGGEALFLPTDVSVKPDVEQLVVETLEHFGRVDILVNCAAITRCYEPFLEISSESWRRIVDVNLTGTFLCSQAVARHMVQRRSGKIINVGSVGSFKPERDAAHYCTAKGGLEMLTKSMALDLSPYNVLVNALHPGATRTREADGITEEQSDGHGTSISRIPLGRFGEVDEVAAAVAFLASPEASYFQGSSLVVDGGYLLI